MSSGRVAPSPKRREIAVSCPYFIGNEQKYVAECMATEWVSSVGRFVAAFESCFASSCGVSYGVACSSGTSALHLALRALGVSGGDEVIVPALTYIATANAVTYCGARPVFVDAEPATMNLDVSKLEARITRRTKAVVPVHLYGHPADMNPILEIARRRGLFVVEDAAEAHGALYRGRSAGALAHVAAFSFFGNKIITTGEGGMLVTGDPELAAKARLMRGQGMDPDRRYWFPMVGYNYRMTNIQAAIGLAQTERLSEHLSARRRVSGWYREHLGHLTDFLKLPVEAPWATHAFWMYTIMLTDAVKRSRDDVMAALAVYGIETRPVFYPLPVMPPYREPDGRYPVAEALARRGICLPTHARLSEADVEFVSHHVGLVCST